MDAFVQRCRPISWLVRTLLAICTYSAVIAYAQGDTLVPPSYTSIPVKYSGSIIYMNYYNGWGGMSVNAALQFDTPDEACGSLLSDPAWARGAYGQFGCVNAKAVPQAGNPFWGGCSCADANRPGTYVAVCPAGAPMGMGSNGLYCTVPTASCPANMAGTPCACNTGHVPNPAGAGCVLEQYTLSLKTDPDQSVEPSQSVSIIAMVKDAQGNGKNGVMVSIKVDVDTYSGGHDHGETVAIRKKGSLNAASGTTGADGTVSFTFNAPDASGTHQFTAKCVSPACSNDETAKIDVKVDGLISLSDSPLFVLIKKPGATHGNGHYLTPEAAAVLRNMAASYFIEDRFWQLKKARRGKKGQYTYTPSKLYVNDASLVWGGKFDIYGGWKGDHKGHKRGIVVDLRANQININNGAIPPESFDNFQKMAKSYSAKAKIHCANKTREPPSCILNGSEDINRHFHVILIGGIDK